MLISQLILCIFIIQRKQAGLSDSKTFLPGNPICQCELLLNTKGRHFTVTGQMGPQIMHP
jgi:hypothetical protein